MAATEGTERESKPEGEERLRYKRLKCVGSMVNLRVAVTREVRKGEGGRGEGDRWRGKGRMGRERDIL